uniref:FAA_hydrolase domain-containing protein n=1 Tax=Elaeophora elaphi TaxID=1147741 RepID=A0A0R3RRF2_9BILA
MGIYSSLMLAKVSRSAELAGSRRPSKVFKKQKSIGPFVEFALKSLQTVLVRTNDNLLSETYYHGTVNYADVKKLLVRDGDFQFGIPEVNEKQVIIFNIPKHSSPKITQNNEWVAVNNCMNGALQS